MSTRHVTGYARAMSQRQAAILGYLQKWRADPNYYTPPTVRQIMAGLSMHSTGTIWYAVLRLAQMGYLTVEPGTRRNIILTAKGRTP